MNLWVPHRVGNFLSRLMSTGFSIKTSFQSDSQSAGQSLCYMVCLLVSYEILEFCCAVHNVFTLIGWSAVVVVCYQHFRTMSVPSLPLRMVLTCCHKMSVTNYQVMLQTIPDRGRMVSYLPPKLTVLSYLGMANYHQSLVEMVEHNRIKLVRVPGYMGFDGN